MNNIVQWSRNGSAAILSFDYPLVNAISQAVRAALVEGVQWANSVSEVPSLIIICAGRTFFIRADLREFGNPSTGLFLNEQLKPELLEKACADVGIEHSSMRATIALKDLLK